MWKFRLLKWTRVVLSLAVLAGFALAFSSLAEAAARGAKGEFLPSLLHTLGHPAVLPAAALAVVVFGTLLFGRFYCSVCCPVGVLQDIAARAGKLLRFKYVPLPDFRKFRYTALVLLGALAIGGWMVPLGFFDPYSLFGRNATELGQPLLVELCNALYSRFDFVTPMEDKPSAPAMLLVLSGMILLLILLAAMWRGRIFCNLLCPVGALLGLLAKRARFPLRLDPEKCVKCGKCVKVCKAGCIDIRAGKLDFERCVDCMNCGSACRFGAIGFGGKAAPKESLPVDPGRRSFLALLGIGGAAGVLGGRLIGRKAVGGAVPAAVMPPGAGSSEAFHARCTGCGLCIANCTGRTLTPALFEYGLSGVGQPRLSFEKGRCEFNCHNCSRVCPTGALKALTIDEKRRCRIGMVEYFRERCVVVTDGTSCGACAEHCPTGALQMVPYGDGLTIPHVIEELCIGCGSCEFICPVLPVKAVVISGSPMQQQAADPKQVLKKHDAPSAAGADDFPF